MITASQVAWEVANFCLNIVAILLVVVVDVALLILLRRERRHAASAAAASEAYLLQIEEDGRRMRHTLRDFIASVALIAKLPDALTAKVLSELENGVGGVKPPPEEA